MNELDELPNEKSTAVLFDFDNLYKLVSDMNKSTKEKCLICHLPIEQKEMVLKCSHEYHHKCLPITKVMKTCPYCGANRKDRSIIVPDKHTEISKILVICQSIIKSGVRKGQVCGRNKCNYHNIDV